MKFDDVLCVIPARGGSVGIPNKNMQKLGGLPLFVYSVRQALDANIPPSCIVVSSDSEEILDLASAWRVVAHRRPDDISGGAASTESALLDALDNAKYSGQAKCVLTLQPTSPLRLKGRVEDCLNKFMGGDYDSLLTTTKLYPFFWRETPSTVEGQTPLWVSSYPLLNRPMRQELKAEDYYYFDNGNIYLTDSEHLCKSKSRLGYKVCVYPITEFESMQIDTELDLQLMGKIISGTNGSILRMSWEAC